MAFIDYPRHPGGDIRDLNDEDIQRDMTPAKRGRTTDLFPIWLIRSKVSPTRQRVEMLSRDSIIRDMARGTDATLSLVHAPAGYGKSTLLSLWRNKLLEEGHRVCWLSLGREDNDVNQLLTYILYSLHENGLDLRAGGTTIASNLSEFSRRDFISLILHIIAEQSEKVVFVFDDFENLDQSCIDEVITPLLQHAPENLHIAIATRDDSRLKTADLEARAEAIRYGAQQLRFSREELEELLGANYRQSTIEQIHSLTEGWPVVVQMIHSAAGLEHDIDELLQGMRADNSTVTAYLSEEVISKLSPDVQAFLMDIAIVDRIDTSLADHLRESQDSQTLFSEAQALDALLLPVDSVESSYRLHPVFREHLLERLRRTSPERLKILHAGAAVWFHDQGDLVEAVRHNILAGRPDQALGVVAHAGGLFIWPHEGLSRLRLIMELFDEAFILGNPLLSMIQALLHVKKGNVFEARRIFDATVGPLPCEDKPWDTGPGAQLARDTLVMESLLSIYEGREIADSVCDELEECARRLTPADGSVALGQHCTILCVAYLQRGNFAKARHYAELGLPAFFSGGSVFGALYLYFHLGDISFSEGDGAQAEHYYKAAMDLARRHFSDDQDIKLAAAIFMTELNFETGIDGTAYRNVANIPIQLERHEAWFDIYAAGYATVAHLEYAQFGLEASLAVVEQAFAYAARHRLDRLEKLLTGLRMELLLKADQVDTAREVLDASDIDIAHYRDADFTQVAWRERFVVVPAVIRLLVREGRYDEARDHLAFFAAQAGNAGHRRALLKFEILSAVSGDLAGDDDAVIEHLDNAVALYRRSGFIRDFLNEAPRMTQLVERYMEQMAGTSAKHEQRAAAREIAERLKKEEAGVDEVAHLLSDREIEVLQQLSHGYSNKLIGRKMDVSDSTVRFHLRNIFAKLNVKSRLQAVSVAQQRRLI